MEKSIQTTLSIDLDVPISTVQDTLCSAFEGGSNYWYMITKFKKPTKIVNSSALNPGEEGFKHLDYPTNPGGYLMISDEKIAKQEGIKPTVKRLDLESIREGVKIMARDYPFHFSNMFNESGDAETGDVLLQCCVFGKIVYG